MVCKKICRYVYNNRGSRLLFRPEFWKESILLCGPGYLVLCSAFKQRVAKGVGVRGL